MKQLHLSKKQWIYFFHLYETNPIKWFKKFFSIPIIANKNQHARACLKSRFKLKYLKHKGNPDIFMSNKKKKKNKRSIRTKRPIDVLNPDFTNWLAEHYIDLYRQGKLSEEEKKEMDEKLKEQETSNWKLESVGLDSKSNICNIKKRKAGLVSIYRLNQNKKDEILKKQILNVEEENGNNLGREPLTELLKKRYLVNLSSRQIGNKMNQFGIKCELDMKLKPTKEIKDSTAILPNYTNRDYDNLLHEERIISLDTTYIPIIYNPFGRNFAYLTVAIDWKSKEILALDLSYVNDTISVMNVVKKINFGGKLIIHSDHGYQFTSHEYMNYVANKKWIQSLSRVGNSLDNLPVEHFFKVLKTEMTYKFKSHSLSFDELKNLVENYIVYYNNKRIQKKLNWMSPTNYRITYNLSQSVHNWFLCILLIIFLLFTNKKSVKESINVSSNWFTTYFASCL